MSRKSEGVKTRVQTNLAETIRHLFIFALFCILVPVLAQTTHSQPQPRQAKGSDLSTNSASVDDWENRLMANDPKVRADAEAALVQEAGRFAACAETIPQHTDFQRPAS